MNEDDRIGTAADAVYIGEDPARFWSLMCELESAVLEHHRVRRIDPAPGGPDLDVAHNRLCEARDALVRAYAALMAERETDSAAAMNLRHTIDSLNGDRRRLEEQILILKRERDKPRDHDLSEACWCKPFVESYRGDPAPDPRPGLSGEEAARIFFSEMRTFFTRVWPEASKAKSPFCEAAKR